MRMISLVSLASLVALSLLALADPALAGGVIDNNTGNHLLPEPGTLGLLAAGAVGVAYLVRKRRK
ncbi:MAG: PEP-CTERM sorting domain-containing protein [Alphaproteobacteria bacterium]